MIARLAPVGRAIALLTAGLLLSGCGTLTRPNASPRLVDSHALIAPDVRMD